MSSAQRWRLIGEGLLHAPPKKIVLSGPSGFLGSRVLDLILSHHALRAEHGLEPGELFLLSSSPGNLMHTLAKRYGDAGLQTIRASRVDYYTQHEVSTWVDHLGSLGVEREGVFVNLAGIAGPKDNRPTAMMDVNYHAVKALGGACERLHFSHLVHSSSQATNAERFGQVPYAKAKSMADFSLSRLDIPVTICILGLLYCKENQSIGQDNQKNSLNLIDLSLLPITPVLGDGTAPLQPLEVSDAAMRIAFLALCDPARRVTSELARSNPKLVAMQAKNQSLRIYDGVGPETMTILQMLEKFAHHQNRGGRFRPAFIGYRNMEEILNVRGIGNLNRQFVSLLRSEQETRRAIVGDHTSFERVLGEGARLATLDECFSLGRSRREPSLYRRATQLVQTLKKVSIYVYKNPKVVLPGFNLSLEIIYHYFFKKS